MEARFELKLSTIEQKLYMLISTGKTATPNTLEEVRNEEEMETINVYHVVPPVDSHTPALPTDRTLFPDDSIIAPETLRIIHSSSSSVGNFAKRITERLFPE